MCIATLVAPPPAVRLGVVDIPVYVLDLHAMQGDPNVRGLYRPSPPAIIIDSRSVPDGSWRRVLSHELAHAMDDLGMLRLNHAGVTALGNLLLFLCTDEPLVHPLETSRP